MYLPEELLLQTYERFLAEEGRILIQTFASTILFEGFARGAIPKKFEERKSVDG